MISRVLEPEVMDSADDAREYDEMDHAVVNTAFADELASLVGRDHPGPILDVGAGTALIPIEICRRLPRASIVAVDLSAAMLERARGRIVRAGLSDRVSVEQADAKRLPFAAASFPVVISNSIIHHIPEPSDAVAEIARVAIEGAALLIRDLCRPDNEASLAALVATHVGEESDRARQLFADSLRAALTVEEMRQLVARYGFAPKAVTRTSDRHWTWRVPPPSGAAVQER